MESKIQSRRLGLTVSEAAHELGVSENTVRRWADAGHLSVYRTPGGQRRFSRGAMEDFLRRAAQPGGRARDAA
jgi:excisionase family DNA binding protein